MGRKSNNVAIRSSPTGDTSTNNTNNIRIVIDPSCNGTPSSHRSVAGTPSNITASPGSQRRMVTATITPRPVAQLDISDKFPDIQSIQIPTEHKAKVNKIKLVDAIQDSQWFGLFIRHCTKEYSFENLLYIVETVQFQKRLLSEIGKDKNEENVVDDCKQFRCKHLILPSTVPKSQIVFGDNQNWKDYVSQIVSPKLSVYDPYKQSVLIYDKYLSNVAVLQVNISGKEKIRLNALFNANEPDKKRAVQSLSKRQLVDVFEESQMEIWRLLDGSFKRFKSTPIFAKISSGR